ncbi:hypothetical protein Mal64_21890 [Pseudobythopirellula maris]|uniref:Phosphatase n=1 Tax=Pseudobythopirellula maris TaxID=2527991 RepID=A0A5C5ZPJ5_9BACT|nr:alkaline phosphatase PhoX [Pseudobythopirellula maris]TWT88701.1 hypothetical protein Mal64_21890 [Pseudobythopirellula maris]
MPATRRDFLRSSAAYAAGFAGLQQLVAAGPAWADALVAMPTGASPYGELVADPEGLLDLPAGFSYRIITRCGDVMDDGLLTPALPDGMAAFSAPDGLTVVVRNHEISPGDAGPFGENGDELGGFDPAKLFDKGAPSKEGTPGKPVPGGTTTLVYDTKQQKLVRSYLSLGGTQRNCAGGPTPWGSWISCEETTDTPERTFEGDFQLGESHGWAFEVPASAEIAVADATPLKAMGRFRREAIAVDPASGVVFQTEDLDDGALYRFLPNMPGKLADGGRLQALAVRDKPSLDTRNWEGTTITPGDRFEVDWIDMDQPESPEDDLRYRAFDAGASRFARGEGMWHSRNEAGGGDIVFACTSGGEAKLGQLWRYTPSPQEGQPGERDEPATLELFIEPNDTNLVHNADNLTATPWGDLVVCEDRSDEVVRLVGVTPEGRCYTLANHHAKCEFSGATFAPDGTTLFVNIQQKGLTLAITGPWRS